MTSPDDLRTRCYYCNLPLETGEEVIEAKTRNAWAHVTCWYDGGPFEREVRDSPWMGAVRLGMLDTEGNPNERN